MKTWRERCVEARERGTFSDEDWIAWSNLNLCPAAETVGGLVSLDRVSVYRTFYPCWGLGHDLYLPMVHNDFDAFESLLDQIEDKALEIKRGL